MESKQGHATETATKNNYHGNNSTLALHDTEEPVPQNLAVSGGSQQKSLSRLIRSLLILWKSDSVKKKTKENGDKNEGVEILILFREWLHLM